MNPEFWEKRRVFLTGHTGFKGSWLALWLQNLGAQVLGYALPPPTQPNLFELAAVKNGMESVQGNILDLEHLRRIIREHRPEVVIHMAAQSIVRRSYDDPVGTYATNVLGTAHILEAVREIPSIRSVVIVSSDKCYENLEDQRRHRETDPLGGNDPYSSSKASAELVIVAYRNSFFLTGRRGLKTGVASARAGNVIGGGDWAADRLIPDVMRAVLGRREPLIRHPYAIRPWQHVLDPLCGYLTLAERLWKHPERFSESWNFGPNATGTFSVLAVLERLRELWGPGISWGIEDGAQPYEAQSLQLDCTKAKAELGWEPQWDLSSALDATVRWYKAYQLRHDVRLVCQDQISSYQNMLNVPETSRR